MIEKHLCTKDFKMDDGDVAFKKGKVYSFTKLPDSKFKGEKHFKCVLDENGSKNHYMPESDMTNYFSKVTDLNNLQENNMERTQETFLSEAQLEAKIVKDWIQKLWWLNDNTDVYVPYNIVVDMEDGTPLRNEDCVEFIINSYNAYKAKEKDKEKQKLLDKKAELELELAEINKQLDN